jgi:hypothetical protein
MSVIVHEKKTLASLPTLVSLVFDNRDTQLDASSAAILPEAEQKLANEEYIRHGIANDPKFDVWAPLTYYWTNGIILKTDTVMVSIKGALAYEVDGDLHINYGESAEGGPQASLTILGNQHTLQIARAVASTFLTVPDIYKGIDQSELQVIHLDGHSHQCHFQNLEWKLNKSEAETDVIEKTVKILNAELPTEE